MGETQAMVPAQLLRLEVEDNERLCAELKQVKAENRRLQKLMVGLRNNSVAVDKMGQYVEGIKHEAKKPAYKEQASIENIVKVIQENGITDLNKVAEKLGVHYGTILRRLKSFNLYPIKKEEIQTYYDLFCQE